MKKIAIIILVIVIALSYACDKEAKNLHTTINGTLLTNGTNDKIKISTELSLPIVKLYKKTDGIDIYPDGYEEVASVTVGKNADYSFDLDLSAGTYFIGFRNLDTSVYFSSPYAWNGDVDNTVSPGSSNNVNLYCLAKSWIRPRFINTNTDVNNVDVFDLSYGIGPDADDYVIDPNAALYFDKVIGKCDSLAPWIHKTWSGKYKYGLQKPGMIHLVKGKLTRNGVTKDVSIEYFAPPFDTSIVEIRY
jgi:hypothetical protein